MDYFVVRLETTVSSIFYGNTGWARSYYTIIRVLTNSWDLSMVATNLPFPCKWKNRNDNVLTNLCSKNSKKYTAPIFISIKEIVSLHIKNHFPWMVQLNIFHFNIFHYFVWNTDNKQNKPDKKDSMNATRPLCAY